MRKKEYSKLIMASGEYQINSHWDKVKAVEIGNFFIFEMNCSEFAN